MLLFELLEVFELLDVVELLDVFEPLDDFEPLDVFELLDDFEPLDDLDPVELELSSEVRDPLALLETSKLGGPPPTIIVGAGVTGAGVTGAGVTGAGVTGAGVTGAGVTCADGVAVISDSGSVVAPELGVTDAIFVGVLVEMVVGTVVASSG